MRTDLERILDISTKTKIPATKLYLDMLSYHRINPEYKWEELMGRMEARYLNTYENR